MNKLGCSNKKMRGTRRLEGRPDMAASMIAEERNRTEEMVARYAEDRVLAREERVSAREREASRLAAMRSSFDLRLLQARHP